MIKKTKNDISIYEFEIFRDFKGILKHAVFTRHSDVNNPETIKKALGTDSEPVAFKEQMHGTKAIVTLSLSKGDTILCGDALITAEKNLPLVIRIADCASILIFDPVKNVIANVHAGWRGFAQKIIHSTIQKMRERFLSNPRDLLVGVSPMIGPCCCRFSDPERELPRAMHKHITEENTVNLWSTAEEQLRECGVLQNHIENPRICTFCNPEDFFSYRREGDAGRFGTAIMLVQE